MNLWIVSDLHADHGEPMPSPPVGADVAVIAGDAQNDAWLVDLAMRMFVVFVCGNHEFYGHEYPTRLAAVKALPGVTVLDNSAAYIDAGGTPVRFIGATLWTDYDNNPVAADLARRSMNDHRLITWRKDPWQRFLPRHASDMHASSRRYIADALATPYAGKTVVVTHHAPHENSVHPRFAGQLLNHAYYSDLEPVIEAGKPDLWVHGHVHNVFDYRVGATRVLANPRGYPRENPEFNPGLVVTI